MKNSTTPSAEKACRNYCSFCPGYCCYKLPGSVLLITAEDINRIARSLQLTDGEVRKCYIEGKNTFKTRRDGSCIFLTDGLLYRRCSIHSFRPQQCRDFPYDLLCPYLHCSDLLAQLHPKYLQSLRRKPPLR